VSLWVQITSPTCAVQGTVVHAVEAVCVSREPMRSKRRTVDTLCGLKRARRIGVGVVNQDGSPRGGMTVPWPPYVEEMQAEGYTRCRECMKLRPGKPNRMVPEESRYDPSQQKAG
jgi:hypothetical protein